MTALSASTAATGGTSRNFVLVLCDHVLSFLAYFIASFVLCWLISCRFQNKEYAKVELVRTPRKGCGLRTLTDLAAGSFIMEYCGEVLTHKAFAARKKKYSRENKRHFYFMSLNADEVIDATMRGTLSRFINHSCEPNCETQKWLVDGYDLYVCAFGTNCTL